MMTCVSLHSRLVPVAKVYHPPKTDSQAHLVGQACRRFAGRMHTREGEPRHFVPVLSRSSTAVCLLSPRRFVTPRFSFLGGGVFNWCTTQPPVACTTRQMMVSTNPENNKARVRMSTHRLCHLTVVTPVSALVPAVPPQLKKIKTGALVLFGKDDSFTSTGTQQLLDGIEGSREMVSLIAALVHLRSRRRGTILLRATGPELEGVLELRPLSCVRGASSSHRRSCFDR